MARSELPARALEILLVEDEPDDVVLAEDALRSAKMKARVTVASNAKDALAAATKRKPAPDVILLDLRLPGSNGADLIGQFRAMRVAAPFIIISGMADDSGLVESALFALGAVEFLHKPFDPSDLVETIESVMRSVPSAPKEEVKKGPVRLDPVFRRVWVRGRLVGHLPPRRFALLAELARAKGPLERDHLLRAVWEGADDPQVLAKTVQRLRQDLGPDAERIVARPNGYELVE